MRRRAAGVAPAMARPAGDDCEYLAAFSSCERSQTANALPPGRHRGEAFVVRRSVVGRAERYLDSAKSERVKPSHCAAFVCRVQT